MSSPTLSRPCPSLLMDSFVQNVAHHQLDVTQPPAHPLSPQGGIEDISCVTTSRTSSHCGLCDGSSHYLKFRSEGRTGNENTKASCYNEQLWDGTYLRSCNCSFRVVSSCLETRLQSHLLTRHVLPVERFPENGNADSGNVGSFQGDKSSLL